MPIFRRAPLPDRPDDTPRDRAHVEAMLRMAGTPHSLGTPPRAQLLARLRPWIVARDTTHAGPPHHARAHAREIAPGLDEILALDLSEDRSGDAGSGSGGGGGGGGVLTLTDDLLAPLGDLTGLRSRARANLRGVPVEHRTVRTGPAGIRFDVVLGESSCTVGHALALDDLVRDLTGHEPGPEGTLLALPHRRQLVFRTLDPKGDAGLAATVNALSAFAYACFNEAVEQVTPDVYWWRRGTPTRLVRSGAGRPRFAEDANFEQLVRRLAERGAERGRVRRPTTTLLPPSRHPRRAGTPRHR